MSFQAMAWAIKQKCPSYKAKFMLLCLANYANQSLEAWPSLATLACDTQMSRSTMALAAKELEDAGFIRREQRTRDGVSLPTRYHLLIGEDGPAVDMGSPKAVGVVREPDGGSPRAGRGVVREPDTNLSIEPIIEPINNINSQLAGNVTLEQSENHKSDKQVDDPWPETAWRAYPHPANRGNRKAALAKLKKIPIDDRPKIAAGIANYRDYLEIATWQKPCMMQTWLNQERWKTPIDLEKARAENGTNNNAGNQPAGIVGFIAGEIAQERNKTMDGVASGVGEPDRGGGSSRGRRALAGPRQS